MALAAIAVLLCPSPGRGPRSSARDPWRTFRFGPRAEVIRRAGGRCEAPVLLVWGRCHEAAVEVDHVYPWSKGGPTIVSNAQALCRGHNRRKGAVTPPWWYVAGLERRRRKYFPAAGSVRVSCAPVSD
ncbi:HNH endonuclease [Arthrobacter horti]|uniref:HNH endonuclease n=1 Tax=Arthrobacter TaxID=1663 RepID=UPI00345FB916